MLPHLKQAGSQHLGDVTHLHDSATGANTSAYVHDAAGIVADQDLSAGGIHVVKLAGQTVPRHLGPIKGDRAAEALERDRPTPDDVGTVQ